MYLIPALRQLQAQAAQAQMLLHEVAGESGEDLGQLKAERPQLRAPREPGGTSSPSSAPDPPGPRLTHSPQLRPQLRGLLQFLDLRHPGHVAEPRGKHRGGMRLGHGTPGTALLACGVSGEFGGWGRGTSLKRLLLTHVGTLLRTAMHRD